MQRSDVKKGLFAKLQNSRSETVYKLLAKSAAPLALSASSSDLNFVRDYLLHYSCDVQNTRKRRSKALMSLLLLAISKASLLHMVMALHCILSLSVSNDSLTTDSSEDSGIYLRPDIIKALQRFQVLVNEQTGKLKTAKPAFSYLDAEHLSISAEYILPQPTKKVVRKSLQKV